MLKKFYQNNRVSCGACAYASLVSAFGYSLTEKQACDDVSTTLKSGTDTNCVLRALKKKNIEANQVFLHTNFNEYGRWLYLNSINRLLYVVCRGSNKGKRGRPTQEHHAILITNGMVYDSALKHVLPLEAFTIKYNYKFGIEQMIMVESPVRGKSFAKDVDI
jgi:hypothetical protein